MLFEGCDGYPMSIPCLNKNGFLPVGLHLATLAELAERFGESTAIRRALLERFLSFVELARHVGARRMFVAGSFVTDSPEPGDVDIVIWLSDQFHELVDAGDDKALGLELRLLTREPKEAFGVFDEEGWQAWVDFFSLVRGRNDLRRGLVEVIL